MALRLFYKCKGCGKKKFLVRTRKVKLPIGEIATSKDLICAKCFKILKAKLIESNHE